MALGAWIRESFSKRPIQSLCITVGVISPIAAIILKPIREKYWYPNHYALPHVYPLPKIQNGKWSRTEQDPFDENVFYLLNPGQKPPLNRAMQDTTIPRQQ
jgi:hypothetical protein